MDSIIPTFKQLSHSACQFRYVEHLQTTFDFHYAWITCHMNQDSSSFAQPLIWIEEQW